MAAEKGNNYNKKENPMTETIAFRVSPEMKILYEEHKREWE